MFAAGIGLILMTILLILYAIFVLAGLAFFIAGLVLFIIAAPKRKIRKGKFAMSIVFLSIGAVILSLCAFLFVSVRHSFNI
jgi:hypothetical protein